MSAAYQYGSCDEPQRFDADRIRAALDSDPLRIARQLLGDENKTQSTGKTKRWGSKGASLRLDGALWFDHAIGIGGDLLSLIQHVKSCDFPTALEIASEMLGGDYDIVAPAPSKPRAAAVVPLTEHIRVLEIWRDARAAQGTIVETYLAARGVALPASCRDIRFHPACPMEQQRYPAMVAAMRDIATNELRAVHRTFLLPDGSGKADIIKQKMMLGPTKGAAIKLSGDDEITDSLNISEGIETGLALIGFGFAPVWALGSAGAVRTLEPLPGISCLGIAVDNDEKGVGDAASRVCGDRWMDAGREVYQYRPQRTGDDLADLAKRCSE